MHGIYIYFLIGFDETFGAYKISCPDFKYAIIFRVQLAVFTI